MAAASHGLDQEVDDEVVVNGHRPILSLTIPVYRGSALAAVTGVTEGWKCVHISRRAWATSVVPR
jgi:hypothetical protein